MVLGSYAQNSSHTLGFCHGRRCAMERRSRDIFRVGQPEMAHLRANVMQIKDTGIRSFSQHLSALKN